MGRRREISHLRFLFFVVVVFILSFSGFSTSEAFESDELFQDDDEFIVEGVRSPVLDSLNPTTPSPPARKRFSDSDSSASDSKLQFSLEHAFGNDSNFFPAGSFTARLKTLNHGGQTLTKLRFSRNSFTDEEKEKFKKLLKDDEFYRIRIPSNVLNPPGRGYAVSSVKARCLPRESLDEHFVIHMEGVNVLAVNYGSTGACQYPRLLKFPAKWSFNSYTVMKNSEVAPRTPSFSEETLLGQDGEGEGAMPLERSFWSKYWMYMIPLGLIIMNAVTQAMNLPEEQAAGQPGQPGPQAQQPVAQRAPNPAIRRR